MRIFEACNQYNPTIMDTTIRLAILGSGNGTNAQQISEYFAGRNDVQVVCIIYNVKDAYIAQRARNLGIEARYFGRKDFYESTAVLDYLHEKKTDWVILAGFLWLVPQNMLDAYPQRIINIHPSLLPSFKGAHAVEDAVAYGVKVYGITIHWVNADLDGGKIIAQRAFEYDGNDPEEVHRIGQKIEHALYVETIDKLLKQK